MSILLVAESFRLRTNWRYLCACERDKLIDEYRARERRRERRREKEREMAREVETEREILDWYTATSG